MLEVLSKPCTAFRGHQRLAAGRLIDVALAVKAATESGVDGPLLTFDDVTGRVLDLDLRGSEADIAERLTAAAGKADPPRGRGRPKLGVIAREVTLLPQHWDWLAAQPGGASATLRRLVHAAQRAAAGHGDTVARRDATYRFMSAMAGDLPGFEAAARALFSGRSEDFATHMVAWPRDLRNYALKLAAST